MSVLSAIGDSLYEAFSMFWETLWALVLGFGLSGAVQAFVSRGWMPGTVGKAGFLGMVSSSCSYAAAALAKSLFARAATYFFCSDRCGSNSALSPPSMRMHIGPSHNWRFDWRLVTRGFG
ncbi:MAG: hypothetical protein JO287_21970 [Pseudonocardiales bacterium]|nr:hypothetical protein [Pseudonocardiales bacterium]